MSRSELNTDWRKVSSALYKKPADGKIFGSVEIDVTDLEAYVNEKRKEGLKITLTHIFTLAVGRALKNEVPQLNCYVRRGNIIHRKQIDAAVSVLLRDNEMSSVRVENVDQLNLTQLTEVLTDGIQQSRSGDESKTMQMKSKLARIPWPFRGWLFSLIKTLTVKWGISAPSLGLTANNFGSFVVTNIGSIGLDSGFPALFPASNVAFVFVMGGVSKKPVVINDEIVIRRMITLSSAMDHRVVDAIHGGKLFKYIKQVVRDPSVLE